MTTNTPAPRVEEIWTRYLAGDALDAPEEQRLLGALADPALRRRLLEDRALPGAPPGLLGQPAREEALVGGVLARIAAGHESEDGAAAARRRSRRRPPRAWSVAALVAAAAAVALFLASRSRDPA